MTDMTTVDLTPTPRILHILGDIPFAIWQCFAEFIDNSIDAFSSAEQEGCAVTNPRIDITWSSAHIPDADQEIVVADNGRGMTLVALQNAAKAGYSSNDPIHNLGLFGMGFNIATARLGDESYFWSTRSGDKDWVGIRIDFDELVKNQSFSAPVVTKPKTDPLESGTMIVIRRLRGGTHRELTRKRQTILSQLARIYSPILGKGKVRIVIDNQALLPRDLCVWGENRFVVRKGKVVHAVQRIDAELSDSYFDMVKNRYITEDEYYSLTEDDKRNVRKRKQHLTGWIGVQRYGDVSDYGIDFIRNGRKILMADKRLFEFTNPETGLKDVEYPVDLGSTYGGRIVGELNVDYLIPTYQKNEFLPSGNAWQLTYDAVHGAGPMQRKNRVKLGYDGDNSSVMTLMCTAFRRPEAGTENLCVRNEIARQMAQRFYAHDPEYKSDVKWYALAKAVDNGDALDGKAAVDDGNFGLPLGGQPPTTDIDGIIGPQTTPPSADIAVSSEVDSATESESLKRAVVEDSKIEDLVARSEEDVEMSGEYKYANSIGGLRVKAHRLLSGEIRRQSCRVPCSAFKDGIEIDYFYDTSHPTLLNYPLTPKQLLLVYLAQSFCDRDPGISILPTFWGLMENCLADESINVEQLRERAKMFIDRVKDLLPSLFKERMSEARRLIDEDSIDKSIFLKTLVSEAGGLYKSYQDESSGTSDALAYVPDATLVRFIERFPEMFFDDKVFVQPYESICCGDNEPLTKDLRRRSVSVVTGYLRDLASLVSGGHKSLSKQELVRFSNSIMLLARLIRE